MRRNPLGIDFFLTFIRFDMIALSYYVKVKHHILLKLYLYITKEVTSHLTFLNQRNMIMNICLKIDREILL